MFGREILNYTIDSKLGEGGMATVWKARHNSLHSYAAIKVLHPVLAADPAIRSKFGQEARLLATLQHPNIVRVLDYQETGNELFLIMELVEGRSLEHMLRNETGPLPEPRIRRLFGAMLDGFAYAHNQGMVHRDIKPSNIIITPNDEPRIIDFGIAKILEESTGSGHTRAGTRIGTPAFMSPEQVNGRAVDKRSDIYALGVTLFHMLTGRAPYNSDTHSEFEIQQKIVMEPLPEARSFYPPVSDWMQALVTRATEKNPVNRFADCADFKMALLNESAIPPPPQPPVGIPLPPPPPLKRDNTAAWVIGSVVAMIIVVAIVYGIQKQSRGSGEDGTTTGTTSVPVITTGVTGTSTSAPTVFNAASFPGGAVAWRRFLGTTVNNSIPKINGASPGKYVVNASFTVDAGGNVTNISTSTSHGYGMEAEAERAIRQSPSWTAATQGGVSSAMNMNETVTFVVEADEPVVQTEPTSSVISDYDQQRINSTLSSFYAACDNFCSIDPIMTFFSFPLTRYYNSARTYLEVRNEYVSTCNRHSSYTIKGNRIWTFIRIAGGYKVNVTGSMSFTTQATGTRYPEKSFDDWIEMDENYKITAMYKYESR